MQQVNRLHVFLVASMALAAVQVGCAGEVISTIHELQADQLDVQTKEMRAEAAVMLGQLKGLLDSPILEKLNDFYFPLLPLIPVGPISICLTGLRLVGLTSISTSLLEVDIGPPTLAIPIVLPEIHFTSKRYIAGGKLHNLFFVGEDALSITIKKLKVIVSFTTNDTESYCPLPGTSNFRFSLERFIVKFEGLAPGTNHGELVNAFMSGVGDDVIAFIDQLVNDKDGDVYALIDNILIKAAEKFIPACAPEKRARDAHKDVDQANVGEGHEENEDDEQENLALSVANSDEEDKESLEDLLAQINIVEILVKLFEIMFTLVIKTHPE